MSIVTLFGSKSVRAKVPGLPCDGISPIHLHSRGELTSPEIAMKKGHTMASEGRKQKPMVGTKWHFKNMKNSILRRSRNLRAEIEVFSIKVYESEEAVPLLSATDFVYQQRPPKEVPSQHSINRAEYTKDQIRMPTLSSGRDNKLTIENEDHSRIQSRKRLVIGCFAQHLLKVLVQKRFQKVASRPICTKSNRIDADESDSEVSAEHLGSKKSKLSRPLNSVLKMINTIFQRLPRNSNRHRWSKKASEEYHPNPDVLENFHDRVDNERDLSEDIGSFTTLNQVENLDIPEASNYSFISERERSGEFLRAPVCVPHTIGQTTLDHFDYVSLHENLSEGGINIMSDSKTISQPSSSGTVSQSSLPSEAIQLDVSDAEETHLLSTYLTDNAINTIEIVDDSIGSTGYVVSLEISSGDFSETELISKVATNASNLVSQAKAPCTPESEETQCESEQTGEKAPTIYDSETELKDNLACADVGKTQTEATPKTCNATVNPIPVRAEVLSPVFETFSTRYEEDKRNCNELSSDVSLISVSGLHRLSKIQTERVSHAKFAASLDTTNELSAEETKEACDSVLELKSTIEVFSDNKTNNFHIISGSKVIQTVFTKAEEELGGSSRGMELVSSEQVEEIRSEAIPTSAFVSKLILNPWAEHSPVEGGTKVEITGLLDGIEAYDNINPGRSCSEETKLLTPQNSVAINPNQAFEKEGSGAKSVTNVPHSVLHHSYNPCSKTIKAWIDYDSDDDSIFQNFFAAHAKVKSTKDLTRKIVSTEATIDTNIAIQPAGTPTDSTELSDLSLTKHKISSCSGVWKRISLQDLFASVTPDSASPTEPISRSQIGLVGTSAERLPEVNHTPAEASTPENVHPITRGLGRVTSSKETFSFSEEVEAFDGGHLITFDGTECGNSASTDDPAENCRRDLSENNQLWMRTELLLLNFEERDCNIYQSVKSVISRFSNDQNGIDNLEGYQSQGHVVEPHTDLPYGNSITSSIDIDLLSANGTTLGLGTKTIARVSKANLNLEQTKRRIIIGFRRIFLHILESIIKPCDEAIKKLTRALLSLRRVEARVFSLGSGVNNDIAILCEGLLDNEFLDCSHWSARIKICEDRLSCIDEDFTKVVHGLGLLENEFLSNLKTTIDNISKIKVFTHRSLENFSTFIECNYPHQNGKSSQIALRFTQVEEFKKISEWYCGIDVQEFENILSRDFESLIKAKRSISSMIELIHTEFVNVKKAMKINELSSEEKDLFDSIQPQKHAKEDPEPNPDVSTNTTYRRQRKRHKSKRSKRSKRRNKH